MDKTIDIPLDIRFSDDETLEERIERQNKNGLGFGVNVYFDAYVRVRKDETDES